MVPIDSARDSSGDSARLGQAISDYLSTLPAEDREVKSRELARFARWLGADTPVRRILPRDLERYQEGLPESSVDINKHLEPLKTFLTHLRSRKLTDVNLGAQVRLRRSSSRRTTRGGGQPEAETLRITEEGFSSLAQELDSLEKEIRPQVTEELSRAYADKDFRENAPYEAAKQRLGQVQGRINEIRAVLSSSAIYTASSDEVVDLGMTVTLRDLGENEDVVYTIVGAGEVNLREGRISVQSPVGAALVNRRTGDVVEVTTPSGPRNYRVERIESRRAGLLS